jgi:N-glycosylase/DNA lyase
MLDGTMDGAGLDLARTMRSGQFFRYKESDEGASVVFLVLTEGKAIRLTQSHTGAPINYSGASKEFIARFLGLTKGQDVTVMRLKDDPLIAPLIAKYPGVRIMRADPHETIIGFICSTQSNIPKIRMNMERIAELAGRTVDGHRHLPLPGTPLDIEAIRNAKTGYRAPYIAASNAMLTKGFLDTLRSAPYREAHAMLQTLPGVGPKVADCVCLYALGHHEAFPVDVHIGRAMKKAFPRSRLGTPEKARRFAQQRWGKDAGLAQQYLFEHARAGGFG